MFEVQKRACATCIYRKDSSLSLAKLEADVADPHMPGFFKGHRICHHSKTACCRGFWNRHKNKFQMGQIAQRLKLVAFVVHDTLAPKPKRARS
jgi:hypothetical protein